MSVRPLAQRLFDYVSGFLWDLDIGGVVDAPGAVDTSSGLNRIHPAHNVDVLPSVHSRDIRPH